ncbi:TetR family transcriptional regulator [Caulobacter sp. 17J80-11]|uniref:TetR family transcriptional regulator n=1 Tax=Caulobacter sp. 17J80-11 TaxID=2763502 RepID=UPI001653C9CD|nr:TetR family transcriptional regulator [Caulobacter sp. 17J80-11]MBC6982228.1 TetR family transcriptional regulator [Caulobacter sp. 17J80-11]
MTDPAEDLLDRAAAAALALAAERPWGEVALKDVARKADIPFADLYVRASSKAVVVDWLARRFDLAALKNGHDEEASAHDRLFDAVMRRLEAMEPHRAALIAMAGEDRAAVALRLPRTARALLEGAGIDASGTRGAARLAAMTAVWARVLQVWRDDEGALNRTMAEIDKRLRQMNDGLKRVGAGF